MHNKLNECCVKVLIYVISCIVLNKNDTFNGIKHERTECESRGNTLKICDNTMLPLIIIQHS